VTSTHRRHNPLIDEWVLVSPGRTKRPWLGQTENVAVDAPVRYDPECYLCPSNTRLTGDVNPPYEGTFVFANDFAALRPDTPPERHDDGLLRSEAEDGTCRVICYSPRHDLRMALMEPAEITTVIDLWRDQAAELGARVVKTYYTEDFDRITETCPVPVVIAGGPKTDDALEVLNFVRDGIDKGAIGVNLGRNIWQHHDPVGMANALRAVIHEDAAPKDALHLVASAPKPV
jgi:hypothetical protein